MPAKIEIVPAQNGKLEDKLVFGAIILTLILASLLLYFSHHDSDEPLPSIPKPIIATLTQLGIAGEELQLMRELENATPELDVLEANGIEPFTKPSLSKAKVWHWRQKSMCFIGTATLAGETYQIKLLLPEGKNQSSLSFWRYKTMPETSVIDLCNSHEYWHSVQTHMTRGKERHAH